MKKSSLRFLTFCCVAGFCGDAFAATPLSQYGQIQNVQNYSSNPFWSPGSQYNKRIAPSPVYATGPDVETADCQTVVASLVAVQCAAQNNCTNMRVSDIRPAIMTGLSRLPGHNYASSCAGYIDSAFESYQNQYTNTVQPSAFPAATGAAPATQQNDFKINNPYEIKKPAWADGVKERATELQQLQSQGAPTTGIRAAAFPTTINDVSLSDRMQNLAAGYAPYKDAIAYSAIELQSIEDAMAAELNRMAIQRKMDTGLSDEEYCKLYPLESDRCPQSNITEQQIIAYGSGENTNNSNEHMQNHGPSTHVQQNYHIGNPPQSGSDNAPAQNNVHNGQCTPYAASRDYTNEILSTGKYEQTDSAFDKSMNTVFRAEGGCARERQSVNSITCYGLTQKYNPEINVQTITRPQAEEYIYKKYYRDNQTHTLPDTIRGEVFHVNFWTGSYGTRLLRRLLNVNKSRETPVIEPELVTAANNYQGDLFGDYMDLVQQHMVAVARDIKRKDNVDYMTNFMRRVRLMRENGCHVVPPQPLTR